MDTLTYIIISVGLYLIIGIIFYIAVDLYDHHRILKRYEPIREEAMQKFGNWHGLIDSRNPKLEYIPDRLKVEYHTFIRKNYIPEYGEMKHPKAFLFSMILCWPLWNGIIIGSMVFGLLRDLLSNPVRKIKRNRKYHDELF